MFIFVQRPCSLYFQLIAASCVTLSFKYTVRPQRRSLKHRCVFVRSRHEVIQTKMSTFETVMFLLHYTAVLCLRLKLSCFYCITLRYDVYVWNCHVITALQYGIMSTFETVMLSLHYTVVLCLRLKLSCYHCITLWYDVYETVMLLLHYTEVWRLCLKLSCYHRITLRYDVYDRNCHVITALHYGIMSMFETVMLSLHYTAVLCLRLKLSRFYCIIPQWDVYV
jgi:hypothetical protein